MGQLAIGEAPPLHPLPFQDAQGADALLLVTEWAAFTSPNWAKVKELMAAPVLFDGRNLWNPMELRELGFTYSGIGRR